MDVSRQTTDANVKSLLEDLDLGIAVLAEVIREPTFPPAQLEKVRGELLTGLKEASSRKVRSATRPLQTSLVVPPGTSPTRIGGPLPWQ